MLRVLYFLLFASLFKTETSFAQTLCREPDLPPHQKGLWQEGFPAVTNGLDTALCDGTVTVESDGRICTTGRVSYQQIKDAIGKRPIRAPSNLEVSINGHLLAGTGSVYLGEEAGFILDYVTSYTVNGVSYPAGPEMVDRTFVASRGTIDGVCLDPSFAADPSYYSISHKVWSPKSTDFSKAREANYIYISSISVVAEYLAKASKPLFPADISLKLNNFITSSVSASLFRSLPVLGATGLFRSLVSGTVSTEKFAQPFVVPAVFTEDVQIDTEWDTVIAAMKDGLFTTTEKVPSYFGVFIRKIEPSAATNGCWNVTAAAMDIQAPASFGAELDEYINDKVLPRLQKFGTVGMHMGKRIDGGSPLLAAALNRYQSQCGVELNITPTNCYHPLCKRENGVSAFSYPPQYFS